MREREGERKGRSGRKGGGEEEHEGKRKEEEGGSGMIEETGKRRIMGKGREED